MTLKELLDLRLIHDNVRILVFKKDTVGLGNFTHKYNITRIMGRIVEPKDLFKAGIESQMFDYQVKELWGDRDKNKMAIVIERE